MSSVLHLDNVQKLEKVFDLLKEFVFSFRHDSFVNLGVDKDPEECILFEERRSERDNRGRLDILVNLPASVPLRIRWDVLQKENSIEVPRSSIDFIVNQGDPTEEAKTEARLEVSRRVLENLLERGYICCRSKDEVCDAKEIVSCFLNDQIELSVTPNTSALERAAVRGSFETFDGTGGWELRRPLEISTWELASVYVIDCEGADFQLGIATCTDRTDANFCYQFNLDDVQVRLEVVNVNWCRHKEHCELVQEFHNRMIAKLGFSAEVIVDLAIVQMKDEQIDYDGMRQALSADSVTQSPPWLDTIVKKLNRMTWWEIVRQKSPTAPGASPLKLHAIFDGENEDKEVTAARIVLAGVGRDALRLAAAVAISEESRSGSVKKEKTREQLEHEVEEFYSEDYLAELMVKRKLVSGGLSFSRLGTRKEIGAADAAEMLLALVGAQKLESDMFSVVQLWNFFSGTDSLSSANLHTAGCPRYVGRTLSYMEFAEAVFPVGEREDSVEAVHDGEVASSHKCRPYLVVRYEDSDDVHYRWKGIRPEERRPEMRNATWQELIWDPVLSTFCSPSMLQRNGRNIPLPNKVAAWLRGRVIRKLVTIKSGNEPTPAYKHMREEVLQDGRIVLWIAYEELHGEVCYCRSLEGGLGFERYKQKGTNELKEERLGFSETQKALLSRVFSGRVLPRKITTWLLENRCLADLVPGRKQQGDTDNVDTGKENVAKWRITTKEEYMVELLHVTDGVSLQNSSGQALESLGTGGVVYRAKPVNAGDEEWKELTYSQEQKQWILTGVAPEELVPWSALAHINKHYRGGSRLEHGSLGGCVKKLNPASSIFQTFFPQISGTVLTEIEELLCHRFKNSRLLAEALTHGSATKAATPCCEHLAYVGEAALRLFVSERLTKMEATFFTGSMVVTEGNPKTQTFLSPVGWSGWSTTKSVQAGSSSVSESDYCVKTSQSVRTVEEMDSRLLGCCNHVSYAMSCVMLQLHKAVFCSCAEMQVSIKRFAWKVDKIKEQAADNVLPHLLKNGAPKVLGDVFLACIGAIVMDSDDTEAEEVLKKHFYNCAGLKVRLRAVEEFKFLSPDDVTEETLRKWRMVVNSSDVFPLWLHGIHEVKYLREALKCDDVNLMEDRQAGENQQQLYVGSSPRSLRVSACIDDPPGIDIGETPRMSEDAEESSTHNMVDKKDCASKGQQPEHDGALYCVLCDMWLNGPVQWADHEIGKKHRKAVRRTQAKQQSVEAAALEGKRMKPVPDGFGKKPQFPEAVDDDVSEDVYHRAREWWEMELRLQNEMQMRQIGFGEDDTLQQARRAGIGSQQMPRSIQMPQTQMWIPSQGCGEWRPECCSGGELGYIVNPHTGAFEQRMSYPLHELWQ